MIRNCYLNWMNLMIPTTLNCRRNQMNLMSLNCHWNQMNLMIRMILNYRWNWMSQMMKSLLVDQVYKRKPFSQTTTPLSNCLIVHT